MSGIYSCLRCWEVDGEGGVERRGGGARAGQPPAPARARLRTRGDAGAAARLFAAPPPGAGERPRRVRGGFRGLAPGGRGSVRGAPARPAVTTERGEMDRGEDGFRAPAFLAAGAGAAGRGRTRHQARGRRTAVTRFHGGKKGFDACLRDLAQLDHKSGPKRVLNL